MRIARATLCLMCAALAGPTLARADEIVLRATVRIPLGAAATLGDIADLSGPQAEALAGTVIVPASELVVGWTKVDTDRVKDALEARGGVAWGLVSMRGSECSIGIAAAGSPAHATPDAAMEDARTAAELAPGTIRALVAGRISAALGVEPTRLRLRFDARDEDLLSMSSQGRIVEARITGQSDRVPVRITVFEGEKMLASRSVAVGVLIKRQIAVALREIRRGETIESGNLSSEERWVGPELACVPPGECTGSAAKAALDAGQVITTNDIQPSVVIRRGDLVTVTSISGGVLVRTTARARSGARDGEIVVLESLEPDRKKRRMLTARACGRGQAVVSAEARDEPEEESQP